MPNMPFSCLVPLVVAPNYLDTFFPVAAIEYALFYAVDCLAYGQTRLFIPGCVQASTI